eukprot:CAMPEP_0194745600 /NCGR_PEP_ID=MMETSP0296-20130528/101497_1 /TAXON_ID=39354 /ORGANISM="Heterosigma akashiwo, Strain CCMP2393" /LENGTH=92 /DNA_ID=CAMNT_0039657837 /DNA_START=536 /DNA_END=814 /DNA_ORIENTATION=-
MALAQPSPLRRRPLRRTSQHWRRWVSLGRQPHERSGGNVERAAHRLLEDGAATRPPSAGAAGPPPLPVADVEPRASPATAVTTSHHHGGHTD